MLNVSRFCNFIEHFAKETWQRTRAPQLPGWVDGRITPLKYAAHEKYIKTKMYILSVQFLFNKSTKLVQILVLICYEGIVFIL